MELFVFVEGSLLFKEDVGREKWIKVWARLLFYRDSETQKDAQNLVLFTSNGEDSEEVASLVFSKDVLILGPVQDKEEKRLFFQVIGSVKEVVLAGDTGMSTITWADILGTLVEVLQDPVRSSDNVAVECALREKLEALQQRAISNDEAMNRIIECAQIELKKLRPTNWLETELLLKKNIIGLEEKVKCKRDRVIYELLLTEQSYVRSLLILLHVFKNPCKRWQKELGLSDEHIQELFLNLEEIISIHSLFLEELSGCFRGDGQRMLSEPLSKAIKNFKVYKVYSANYSSACSVYEELVRKKAAFSCFLHQLEEDVLCKGLPLNAYLIMPIQRVPRYVLLLTEIVMNTPENHSDYNNLLECLQQVKNAAQDINAAPKEKEELYKTQKVISSFERHKELQLMTPDRRFVKKGSLAKVCHHGGLKSRSFFLFTDLFFYADKSPSTAKWIICHQFMWTTLSVSDESSKENAIRITSDRSSFVVIAKDSEDKIAWMESFNKVGLVNRKLASLVPQAPVWLPDTKDCMLCAKKFTQINRRHHCRRCGWVVCSSCSKQNRHVEGQGKVKVCDNCIREDTEEISLEDYLIEKVVSPKSSSNMKDNPQKVAKTTSRFFSSRFYSRNGETQTNSRNPKFSSVDVPKQTKIPSWPKSKTPRLSNTSTTDSILPTANAPTSTTSPPTSLYRSTSAHFMDSSPYPPLANEQAEDLKSRAQSQPLEALKLTTTPSTSPPHTNTQTRTSSTKSSPASPVSSDSLTNNWGPVVPRSSTRSQFQHSRTSSLTLEDQPSHPKFSLSSPELVTIPDETEDEPVQSIKLPHPSSSQLKQQSHH